MFPKLSTSTQDTSIADLMVSMDIIITLNLPPFSTLFYVKNSQSQKIQKPLKIKFFCWKT